MTISKPTGNGPSPKQNQSSWSSSLLTKVENLLQKLRNQPVAPLNDAPEIQACQFPTNGCPESPRSLALKLNDLEAYSHEILNGMDSEIRLKEQELKNAQSTGEIDSALKSRLEAEILMQREHATDYVRDQSKSFEEMDASIGYQRQTEMQKMDQAIKKYNRIVVELVTNGIQRQFYPERYYANLIAKLKVYHPGYYVFLTVPGTKKLVGSQFELLCAYQDATTSDILHLGLILLPKTEKRKRSDDDMIEEMDVDGLLVGHNGAWTNAEIQLFQAGVEQFGWGEWAHISSFIQTRNRHQVRKFSASARAKMFKSSASLINDPSDLEEGLKLAARRLDCDENDAE